MFRKISLIAIGMSAMIALASAQPPASPPPRPPNDGAASTLSARITQFNYGPDGRVIGMVIAPRTLVNLRPDWGEQLQTAAKPGDTVTVSGTRTTAPSGMSMIQAQSVAVGRMVLRDSQPPAPDRGPERPDGRGPRAARPRPPVPGGEATPPPPVR